MLTKEAVLEIRIPSRRGLAARAPTSRLRGRKSPARVGRALARARESTVVNASLNPENARPELEQPNHRIGAAIRECSDGSQALRGIGMTH